MEVHVDKDITAWKHDGPWFAKSYLIRHYIRNRSVAP